MCDQDHFEDDRQEYESRGLVTRKQFGVMLGAGVAMMLPRVANAVTVTESDVNVTTPDGTADCYFAHPASGTAAGVLVWPDIFGLRPAFRAMATRLAESGYTVLVINPFYRTQKAPTSPEHPNWDDPPTRDALMALAHSLTPATAATDAKAFVSYLDAHAAVDVKKKIGTTGYCMGGPLVLRTAAARADRIGAAATFHGGGLVTKEPDSPHLLIAQSKAHYLIAIAANDDERDPTAKTVLRETFDRAQLPAEVEVYAGTQHGWCPPDSAVYNRESAEKAWARLLVLLNGALA